MEKTNLQIAINTKSYNLRNRVLYRDFVFDNRKCCVMVNRVFCPVSKKESNLFYSVTHECYCVDVFSTKSIGTKSQIDGDASNFPYARLYFAEKPELFEDLNKKPIIGEEIFGDWQPNNYRQTVYLHYDKLDKETALSTGKFKVYYLIYNNLNSFSDSEKKVAFAIDGKSGKYLDKESGGYSTNYELSKEILQQKIAPNWFDAVNRGLENDDVTCYILSYISGKYKDKQREDIQFRFVHGGDGYWKDYFLKLEKKGCIPYRTKKVKFLCDLELEDSNVRFAIVPIKYNGHFVTIIVDSASINKDIYLFDSSLYSWVGRDSEKDKAFRKFLLDGVKKYEKYGGRSLKKDNLKKINIALNKTDLQKIKQDCGFWTIAFCLKVYGEVHNFSELEEICESDELEETVRCIERGEEPKFEITAEKRKLNEDDEKQESEITKELGLNQESEGLENTQENKEPEFKKRKKEGIQEKKFQSDKEHKPIRRSSREVHNNHNPDYIYTPIGKPKSKSGSGLGIGK